MPVRFLIFILCLSPVISFAKQDKQTKIEEQDLELFEFIAMYDQNDEIFIDAEIDEKAGKGLTSQNVTTSESNE